MPGKKILILGASSYVGSHVIKRLSPQRIIATYCRNPIKSGVYFDSTCMRLSQIIDNPQEFSHALILLGDTNPDSCAADIERSKLINVVSIKHILEDLKQCRIKPVFISSEFIFDGRHGYYDESVQVNPILTYARQKVEIEEYISNNFSDFAILRLSKVFGSEMEDGTIFTVWLKAIGEGVNNIPCAHDQVFSPIYIDDVVEAIIKTIDKDLKGIFHLAGERPFRRIELLEMLISNLSKFSPVNVHIEPKSINDFPLLEKRPLNVSLNPSLLIKALNLKMHKVEDICKMIVQSKFQKFSSKMSLDDRDYFREDKGAKSMSFFCKKKPAMINNALIQELKNISNSRDKENARICLHEGPQSAFQNMVILEHQGKYYRPHKHLTKGETFHIIEGSMAIFIFNEEGVIIDCCVLGGKKNLIYRIEANMYHAVMPISNLVIYHESKLGPFIGEGDSIFADWAPDVADSKKITAYTAYLKGILEITEPA